MMEDLSRLKSNLANGKIREVDFPTYQVINALIDQISKLQKALDVRIEEVEDASSGAIHQLTGDVTAIGPGSAIATIANDAVTYAKIQNVSAASKLLGRGDSGAGNTEELIIGAGLSLSGITLSATAAVGVNWDVLTDGDLIEPELIFADGQVIMLELA